MSEPATVKQKRLFFKLIIDLGWDSEKVKEQAKKKYNLESFADIEKWQISILIDQLLSKLEGEVNRTK